METYHNKHEHRANAGLKKAQEKSLSVDAMVGRADSRQGKTDAPDND